MKQFSINFLILCTIFLQCNAEAGVIFSGVRTIAEEQETNDYSTLSSCRGAWRMNSTDTTEIDRSSAGSDLTWDGSPSRVNADTGYAIDFELSDGLDGLKDVDGGATDINGQTNLTIFIRFKLDDAATSFQYPICKYGVDTNQRQYAIQLDEEGGENQYIAHGFLSSDGTSVDVDATHTTVITSAAEHTLAFVYDDSIGYAQMYLDGELYGSSVAYSSGINNGVADFYIGRRHTSTYGFDGYVAEAGVWELALSANDILLMHTNGIFGDLGSGD